jgi:hypothetical protein
MQKVESSSSSSALICSGLVCSVHLPVYLSVYLSISLSVYLSVYLKGHRFHDHKKRLFSDFLCAHGYVYRIFHKTKTRKN